MIKVKDLEMGVHTGLSIHTGIMLKVEEEGRRMGLRDSMMKKRGRNDSKPERNNGRSGS